MSAPSSLEQLAQNMARDVKPGLDWVGLIGAANDELVAPKLYRRLVRLGSPRPCRRRCACLPAQSRRGQPGTQPAPLGALPRNCWRFNAAGIVPLLLEGGNDLARHADPAVFSRILVDIDLLVTVDDLQEGERVFAGLGLRPLEDTRYAHSPGSYWRTGEAVG